MVYKPVTKFFFLFVLICCATICRAQNKAKWQKEIYSRPGVQLGYAYAGLHRVDAGANYYWTLVQAHEDLFHTFGPSAGINMLFAPGRPVTGMQAGMNYHLFYPFNVSPRINIIYENYFNGDQRIGADLGISFLGVFIYAGYYPPLGKNETKGVTAFRGGIRLVFNTALLDVVPLD